MASSIEYTASGNKYVLPADQETIERSNRFGQHLQECADTLDAFFRPNSASDQWRMPFGRFGDETLTVLAEQSANTSTLAIGYCAHKERSRDGFYAKRSSSADFWQGNGDRRHGDEAVARMLDANWPTLSIDNTGVRELVAKHEDVSFDDICNLLKQTLPYGTALSSVHTFEHGWSWSDNGKPASVRAAVTRETTETDRPSYSLQLTLPHEYRRNSRTNVTCVAHFDQHFGVSYEVRVDEPTLTKLDIHLTDLIGILEDTLERIMDAKVAAAAAKLPDEEWFE